MKFIHFLLCLHLSFLLCLHLSFLILRQETIPHRADNVIDLTARLVSIDQHTKKHITFAHKWFANVSTWISSFSWRGSYLFYNMSKGSRYVLLTSNPFNFFLYWSLLISSPIEVMWYFFIFYFTYIVIKNYSSP